MFLFMTSFTDNKDPKNDIKRIENLIARLVDKDSEALSKLYEIYEKSIYGFAYSILKNADDSQDVLQDAFITIYSSAHLYKPQGKPLAWCLTITRNLALMKIREGSRSTPVDVSENVSMFPTKEFSKDSENKIILQNALAQLPDDSRQIVVLHAMSGMKHREIAEFLGLGLSTVLSKYHRAMAKLKKILREDNYYE